MGLLPIFILSCYIWLLQGPTTSDAMNMQYIQPSTLFIKLVGARKGDNVSDISSVRGYLHRFGYLNSLSHQDNQVDNNYFDDTLEQALLGYQKFFKLNKTGVLDNDTVTMMSKPRCGNFDLSLRKEETTFINEFTRRYQIFPGRPHRTKDHLYVNIQNNIQLPAEYIDAIYQAFVDWERYVPIKFVRTSDPDVVDIEVQFFNGDHGDTYPFDGPNGVLAHANIGQGPMMHFDSEENWQLGDVDDGYDIGTVARHEIGHLLGLGHSDDENALMYPNIPKGTTKEIEDDDIAGIMDLYYS